MMSSSEQLTSAPTHLLAGFVADDAISILREDHRRIDGLFLQFDKARGGELKAELAHRICTELLIHADVEDGIFYPALREAMDVDDLMDEADVEHAAAAHLIAEIMGMRPGAGHYDAKVKVLASYVRHHVQEEQNRMFSKARQARLDMRALGEQILLRKKELQGLSSHYRPLGVPPVLSGVLQMASVL
ncbi:MAG: hemerythrin protein [Betaproteobacteria bacterium]|nr:hemerythrin protein [Betaproteobacteria bacterium]